MLGPAARRAADPRELPHRHPDRLHHGSRCDPCRIGSCAWLGWMTTSFPGSAPSTGDDTLAREPRTGERDIRSEDRQLLLDAIGAATETLVITYTGANEVRRTGTPAGRSAGGVARCARCHHRRAGTQRASCSVIRCSPSMFAMSKPGRWSPGRPFSFDRTVLNAARATIGERDERPPFRHRPLTLADTGADVSLADLVGFLPGPRARLLPRTGLHLPAEVEGIDDAMPLEIDPLREWTVGERLLQDILRGMHPDRALCGRSGAAARFPQGSWAGARPRRSSTSPSSWPGRRCRCGSTRPGWWTSTSTSAGVGA